MYVVFFIFLFLFLLITLPLAFEIKIQFNCNLKKGHIFIKIFKIRIIDYIVKYENNKILLYNNKNIKKIDFTINKEEINFANIIQKEIFKRIYLNSNILTIDIGIINNPFILAIIFGSVQSFLNIIYGIISFQKPTSKLLYKINTYNNKNLAIITMKTKFSISLFNLLFAYLKTQNCIKNKKIKEKLNIEAKSGSR